MHDKPGCDYYFMVYVGETVYKVEIDSLNFIDWDHLQSYLEEALQDALSKQEDLSSLVIHLKEGCGTCSYLSEAFGLVFTDDFFTSCVRQGYTPYQGISYEVLNFIPFSAPESLPPDDNIFAVLQQVSGHFSLN